MATIPEPVARLLEAALVGELTVVDGAGRPVTYPLIPLWDGEQGLPDVVDPVQSQARAHPRQSRRCRCRSPIPSRSAGALDRATIQGDARVIEEDPHGGWERLLPIWEKKEPSIVYFLKARVALPLFFERALIEITPRRVLYWSDGDRRERPGRDRRRRGGRVMRSTPELDARTGLDKLATYPYQILTWVDDAGYPVSVAVEARVNPADLSAGSRRRPASPSRPIARSR